MKMHKASSTLPSDDDYFYCAKQPVVIEAVVVPDPALVTVGEIYQQRVSLRALEDEVFRPARAPTK